MSGAPSTNRKRRSHERSAAGRTDEFELAVERFNAVSETTEPRTEGGARATSSVVADRDDDFSVRRRHLDAHLGCLRVLGGVGQTLRDDVVDGSFDAFAETFRWDPGDRDREGRAARE